MPWHAVEGFDAQSLVDSLPHYVLLVDEEHVIWMANQAVRRTLGVNPEEILGRYCPAVIHDCDGPIPQCPLEEAVRTGKDVEVEIVDEKSGMRLLSCVYDTGYLTPQGKKLYLHTTTHAPCTEE